MQEALDFIRGGTSDSVRTLTEKMNEAAENLDFELAARIRDRITAINKLKERQKVVASRVPEQDVIALVLGGEKGEHSGVPLCGRQTVATVNRFY